MNKLWYLKQCNIFSGLDKGKLNKISGIATEKHIPKNEIIYSAQNKDNQMFILKKGRAKIFKVSADGKIITLSILREGDIFGTMSAVRGGTSGAYAETLEDSHICVIHQEDLHNAIKEMPDIALRLIEVINQRLKEAEDRIEDLVFRNIPGRIAAILLKLAEQFRNDTGEGMQINFKITHQELADMVGATRETVTIVLNDFKNDNLIKISEKYITIIDEKTLKEWAGR
jgi:CRP/FNR family transcriptional regulator, cyclic AMP receptor protein